MKLCTSTTRPKSPNIGDAFLETDTEFIIIWNGLAWREYGKTSESFSNTYSVDFDGTGGFADSGSAFNSIWSGSFSISLWYKGPSSFSVGVDNYLGNDSVVGKGYIEFRQRESSGKAKIELYMSNSYSSSAPYNTYGGEIASSSDFLTANTWNHLVWTADRPGSGTTTSKLYINGSEVTLSAISSFLSSLPNAGGTFDNNTLIAARNNASSGSGTGELYLDGHLDEMAFFNSALSSSDVTAIYNNGVPADLKDLSPSHWWRFGDGTEAGSGTTVYDMSDSGSTNLTLKNGPTYSTDVPT